MDTNQNYEGDPTYGPQFVGPLGSFNNGVVQDNLEDANTMWYMIYSEVIRGVMRLDNEVPQGEELRAELRWTREVLTACHDLEQLHV